MATESSVWPKAGCVIAAIWYSAGFDGASRDARMTGYRNAMLPVRDIGPIDLCLRSIGHISRPFDFADHFVHQCVNLLRCDRREDTLHRTR
jgi:hypothetical protein